jgi:signal peptidase I
MKVRVPCKAPVAHTGYIIKDHIEYALDSSLENLTREIPETNLEVSFLYPFENFFPQNTVNDNPEYPIDSSLTYSIENTIEAFEEKPSEQENATSSARSVWWEVGRLLIKITVIAACFMLIVTFLYGLHRNSDPDMAPMVKDGDLLLFNRLDKDYTIGDLLLLDFQGERQVRRVVARAGDTVDISEEGLIINGGLRNEPEIYEQTLPYENAVSFPLTVGEGQVFALGDARENATDSRVYGPVDTEDTLGTVITVMRQRGL